MTARIFIKLLLGSIGLLAVAMAAVDLLATQVVETYFVQNLTREMADKGRVIAFVINGDPASVSHERAREIAQKAGGRLTLIGADGRVFADSDADATHMENHGNRSEVQSALQGGRGAAVRHSATTGVDYLYVAIPIGSGALRLAMPLSNIQGQVSVFRERLLAATALAFLPAVLVAAYFARGISRRLGRIIAFAGELARGNFRARLET